MAAAKGADAVDEAAAAKVSTRSWSDADLSKLANQAATKLGDPVPVRELVTQSFLRRACAFAQYPSE